MLQMGYHVTLIGRLKGNSQTLLDQSFEQVRLRLWSQRGILFYVEYQIRLLFYLWSQKEIQLLYSVDLDTSLTISIISRLKSIKTLHDAHELFIDVPELKASPIKRWIWRIVGKLSIPHFDERITVNESLASILQSRYGQSYHVIRNLPTPKSPLSSAPEEVQKPYIWYQGVLNEGRGLPQLIMAMESLPELHLYLAGEGDLSGILRNRASESEAFNRIHFLGWLPPDELHAWACGARLGVNLLDLSADNYKYSLANRVFDYIQARLPALHMNAPEYKVIQDQYEIGMLIDSLEQEEIILAIRKLCLDDDLYAKLKANNEIAAQSLNWDSESIKFEEVIRSIEAN